MPETNRDRPIAGPIAQQLAFASDELPSHLDHRARRDRFHETFDRLICGVDFSVPLDQPFFMNWRFARVDGVRVGRLEGTVSRVMRDARSIARSPDDDFFILVNRGPARIHALQVGRQSVLAPNDAILLTHAETSDVRIDGRAGWTGVVVPRERLRATVAGGEDMIARPLVGRRAIGGLLASYAEGLLDLDAGECDAALAEHVGTTVVDLFTLMLRAGRDAAEVARLRGLRAARLQEVLARIKSDFVDPALSSGGLARRLGLSRRYVNDLLFETGTTFTERVLELRLQKARAMLMDRRHDRLKIGEIAYACGFNEVSYFNRCFRRRFGGSPTQYRGADRQQN